MHISSMIDRLRRGPADARAKALAAAALVIITGLVYWPILSGDFILDDDILLTRNALIKSPHGLSQIWFSTDSIDYWPLTNTSLWIEWHLWGANPLGYHITNLALHLAESLLLWLILQKLRIPGAFLAALLFAVHPVNVESVAWIAQRKNLLAMLFSLLSVYWFLKSQNTIEQLLSDSQPSNHLPSAFWSFRSFWYWLRATGQNRS